MSAPYYLTLTLRCLIRKQEAIVEHHTLLWAQATNAEDAGVHWVAMNRATARLAELRERLSNLTSLLSPAAPRFANACEVTCPPPAVQPVQGGRS